MTETAEAIKIHRGLKGVYFDRSPCTFIDGKAGELRYRGYSIHDLAEHSSFEETAWLLLHGELPTAQQLASFDAELKAARKLPAPVLDIIRAIKDAHPMDVLRTAVSALAAFDPETSDNSREATLRKGVRLTSQVPMIVAAHARIRAGREPVPADATRPRRQSAVDAARREAERRCRAIDRPRPHSARRARLECLVIHRARGHRHRGQPACRDHRGDRRAVRAGAWRRRRGRDEDGGGDRRAGARRGLRASKKRKAGVAVTGFGHRVYRAEDPRARHMRAGVERLSKEMGEPKWFEILQAVVAAMAPYARHGVNVNVDFYSGVVYHLLGIKRDLFVPIFAIGRVPGWVVQVLEQLENNILIRPLTLYNGPDARAYVPLAQR